MKAAWCKVLHLHNYDCDYIYDCGYVDNGNFKNDKSFYVYNRILFEIPATDNGLDVFNMKMMPIGASDVRQWRTMELVRGAV